MGKHPLAQLCTKIYKQDWLKYISNHNKLNPALYSENYIENCIDKINNVLLSASNSSSKIVDLKPNQTLTNSYIEL